LQRLADSAGVLGQRALQELDNGGGH